MNVTYGIEESATGQEPYVRTAYRITRNGIPQGEQYGQREIVEQMLSGLQRLPEGYLLSRVQRRGDWAFQASKGTWRTWGTDVDRVVELAAEHLAAAPEREQRATERAVQAEKVATAEAEAARVAAERELLASSRQVEFILNLLFQRKLSGQDGGFFVGPEDREGIEKLTKVQASAYITSLKGDY